MYALLELTEVILASTLNNFLQKCNTPARPSLKQKSGSRTLFFSLSFTQLFCCWEHERCACFDEMLLCTVRQDIQVDFSYLWNLHLWSALHSRGACQKTVSPLLFPVKIESLGRHPLSCVWYFLIRRYCKAVFGPVKSQRFQEGKKVEQIYNFSLRPDICRDCIPELLL